MVVVVSVVFAGVVEAGVFVAVCVDSAHTKPTKCEKRS